MDKIYLLEEYVKGCEEWLLRRGWWITEEEALKSAPSGSMVRVRCYQQFCEPAPPSPSKEPRYKFELQNRSEVYRNLDLIHVLDMLAAGQRGCISLEGCE